MSRGLNNPSRCFLPDKSGARRKSREIDAMLKLQREPKPVVILMSGWFGAGKTTILRQMRLINGPVFSHKELLEFREAIYDNVIQGMQVLVQERNKLGIPLQNPTNEKHELLFSSLDWCIKLEPCMFQPYAEAIDSLWKDSGIQEAHLRRTDFKLYESIKYYFDNIHRIGNLNYLPNNQDIIHAHKKSTFLHRYFVLRDSPFIFADVPAWQNLRRRVCLTSNTQMPLLFIIGCSDYDRTICEDNYLVESLKDFELLCNHSNFVNSAIIILFNKMDLLAEKIQTSDIRKHFPEFQGDPHNLEDVQEFLIQSFRKRIGNNSRQLFYHMTTAVNLENFQKVFESVKNTIIVLTLQKMPLL